MMKTWIRILLFGIMLLLTGCEKDHLFMITARAELYTDKGSVCTVRKLGPKESEIASNKSDLNSFDYDQILIGLAGTSSYYGPPSADFGDTTGEQDWKTIPYNKYTFGFLHIEYCDSRSDLQRHEKLDLFIEPRKDKVVFYYSIPDEQVKKYVREAMNRSVPE